MIAMLNSLEVWLCSACPFPMANPQGAVKLHHWSAPDPNNMMSWPETPPGRTCSTLGTGAGNQLHIKQAPDLFCQHSVHPPDPC